MLHLSGFISLRFASFSSHRLPLLFGDWSEGKYGALSIAVKTSRSKYESYIMQGRIWFDRVSIGHVVGVFYSLIIVQHDGLLTFFNTSLGDLLTTLLLNWQSWKLYKVIVQITPFFPIIHMHISNGETENLTKQVNLPNGFVVLFCLN